MASRKCLRRFIMKGCLMAFYLCFIGCLGWAIADAKEPEGRISKKNDLTIGLIPEQNVFRQVDRYTPLADYLSGKMGVKTKLKILLRYGSVIESLTSAEMDGAFFGSFSYVLAHTKIGVEPLVRPENEDGSSTYHGLIFVRKDSRIENVKDMAGKRFAFVDRATTAGFLLPLEYFKRYGVENYKAYLKEVYFSGTHQDAIYDVLNKKADIGAAKNTVFNRLAAADGRISRDLKILARSPDVPENCLAVRKDIDISLRTALLQALLSMHEDPAGQIVLKNLGIKRFIRTSDKDYAPVYDYSNRIGLNLATYDYVGD